MRCAHYTLRPRWRIGTIGLNRHAMTWVGITANRTRHPTIFYRDLARRHTQQHFIEPLHERRPGPPACRLRPAQPGRTGCCAQSPNCCSSSYFRRCTSGWSGLISRIGLDSGAFCPAAFSMRTRLPDSSFSSATRQAGESVRRKRHAHVLGLVAQRGLHLLDQVLVLDLGFLVLLLLGLVFQLAEVEAALGHRHQFLAVELGAGRTASTRRRGRSAAALRRPSCGRSRGAGCSWRPRSCRR